MSAIAKCVLPFQKIVMNNVCESLEPSVRLLCVLDHATRPSNRSNVPTTAFLRDPKEHPLKPLKRNTNRKSKNSPVFDLRTQLYRITGVDLTQADGLNVSTVQDIIADIGTDMSKWTTSKHFCSWLRVSPENKKTGGIVFSSFTKKTKNRANKALRMAAFALAHAHCALGAFYRRVRAQHGGPAAITATAHKLARTMYKMIKDKIEYVDLDPDYYEQKYKSRIIRSLKI